MNDLILEINNLHKRYGRVHAVNNLSLKLKKGSVFGLLGPNGSGKTTTLGVLLGVVKASEGSFKWFGESPNANSRKRIGAILERPIFYPYMSAYENLKVVCKIKGISFERIDECLKLVGLLERKHDDFKTYSLGMKQRLSIGSAMLANPEVLILDEPTNGLDPSGINDIRELIIQIAQSGKTIILASHLLDEVQKVCQDFIILNKGKLLYHGNVETDLNEGSVIEIGADDPNRVREHLDNLNEVNFVKEENRLLTYKTSNGFSTAQLNEFLAEKNIFVSHLVKKSKSLEKRFLEILNDHA